MNSKQKVIERLKKYPITNTDEAVKFLFEKDGATDVREVDWKWEVSFDEGDDFKFYSDDDLIAWTIEQRDSIEECNNG